VQACLRTIARAGLKALDSRLRGNDDAGLARE
jgi:hypothetical protein